MKTSAVAAAWAAVAPAVASSVVEVVRVVPSMAACALMASYGPMRYYSSQLLVLRNGIFISITYRKLRRTAPPPHRQCPIITRPIHTRIRPLRIHNRITANNRQTRRFLQWQCSLFVLQKYDPIAGYGTSDGFVVRLYVWSTFTAVPGGPACDGWVGGVLADEVPAC